MLQLQAAYDASAIPTVRELFEEYEQAIGVDLCFQGFAAELDALPGDYAPPRGRLFVAAWDAAIAGCVALRPIDAGTCEMKRLYVRPDFRGHRIGQALMDRIIADARDIGYARMRLDTLPAMQSALAMYRKAGFVDIAPYRDNPHEGVTYMELALQE